MLHRRQLKGAIALTGALLGSVLLIQLLFSQGTAAISPAWDFLQSTPHSKSARHLQADATYFSSACPTEDCGDVPMCYDTRLNTGIPTAWGGRLHSDSYLGGLSGDMNSDYVKYSPLETNDLGIVQSSPTSKIKSRAFMGAKPTCEAASVWADDSEHSAYQSYMTSLQAVLKDRQLTCDLTQWEETTAEIDGRQEQVCRSTAQQLANDAHGKLYADATVRTLVNEGGEWSSGWAYGFCDKETAAQQRCHENLPGGVKDGKSPGLLPDGSLNVDFSSGLAGELGVPQIAGKGSRFLRRSVPEEWYNEVSIVTDSQAPEEGNVARLDSYILNMGTPAQPKWQGGPLGALVTTRLYGSGSYEVRAKVPRATGFVWALWTFWGGIDLMSDQRVPEQCAHFDTTWASVGDELTCDQCRDPLPTGGSPMWVSQGDSPGIFLPERDRQVMNHEIDIEIPGNSLQVVKPGIGTSDSKAWKVPEKYNTMNMNNYRFTNWDGMGTYSNTFVVTDKPLQGDGKYHDYRFDWHTGGLDKSGKFQKARVDYYFDGDFIGSNDLMVPLAASRFWIALWPHGSGKYNGKGNWNGRIGFWRDPNTGEIHANRDAEGKPLPTTATEDYALYASTYVSSVRITPYYEDRDIVIPTAFDQPHMNRRVACASNRHLQCGTNAVVPLRTSNHYLMSNLGKTEAPCCGAICMSTEAAARAGVSGTTTDASGNCPAYDNTVPGAWGDRPGTCHCRKGAPDSHGDPEWSSSEYDDTCTWVPNKAVPKQRCDNTPKPMPMGNGDPWKSNQACTVDTSTACFPPQLTPEEAQKWCEDWVGTYCGQPGNGAWWEIWAEYEAGWCWIRMEPQSTFTYTPPAGHTANELTAVTLPSDKPYNGCNVNYLEHPPAHDGSSGKAGCEWFIRDHCPGSTLSMFDVAVSSTPDSNGNKVCAFARKPEYESRVPTDRSYRGHKAKCDIDYEVFRPPCSSDQQCQDWKTAHCDEPTKLAASCNGAACQFSITDSSLKATDTPLQVCYHENPKPFGRGDCDWDYQKFPPCGGTRAAVAEQSCQQWVENHCSSAEAFTTSILPFPDRKGHYVCSIESEWEQKVGGAPAACSIDECAKIEPSQGTEEGRSSGSGADSPVISDSGGGAGEEGGDTSTTAPADTGETTDGTGGGDGGSGGGPTPDGATDTVEAPTSDTSSTGSSTSGETTDTTTSGGSAPDSTDSSTDGSTVNQGTKTEEQGDSTAEETPSGQQQSEGGKYTDQLFSCACSTSHHP